MKKYILLSIIALGSISCTDSFLEEKNGIYHYARLF